MNCQEVGFLDWEEGPRREKAFAVFVEEHSPLVKSAVSNTLYRYASSATRVEVEDLHNSLFVGLMEDDFRRLRQFQGRSSLATYIRVVTTRHVIDFLRRQRPHVSLDTTPTALDLVDHRGSPQDHLETTEQELAVQRAVERLQPRERLLLKLVFDRELEPSQVCRTLGITMSAYYNQKSRLLKKMRKLCEESAPGSSQGCGRKRRD